MLFGVSLQPRSFNSFNYLKKILKFNYHTLIFIFFTSITYWHCKVINTNLTPKNIHSFEVAHYVFLSLYVYKILTVVINFRQKIITHKMSSRFSNEVSPYIRPCNQFLTTCLWFDPLLIKFVPTKCHSSLCKIIKE